MEKYTFSGNEKAPCHSCGKQMVYLAKHWQGKKYDCGFPAISQRQEEIIRGLILGDGSLSFGNSLPYLQMNLTNEDFLLWLRGEFEEIGGKYNLVKTAEEVADESRESGWNKDCDVEDCNDVYQFRTSIHPHFKKYESWYSGSKKRFPNNLNLTSLESKVWYCCDGDLKNGTTNSHKPIARITSRNEADNPSKLLKIFQKHNFNPYWEEQSSKICFTVDETVKFLEWLGEPLPGFEYKWIEG
jgi:hypothetical protein